ncbi:MAG: ABC transporter permease [Pseudomonadota bacterium]
MGSGLLTAFLVSVIIFIATRILPGDAAEIRLGQAATEETLNALRREMGLDRSLFVQYWSWLSAFLQGDLGRSLAGNTQVSDLIAVRYGNSLAVLLLTAAIAIPLSVGLGLLAAMFPGGRIDRLVTLTSVSLVAFPDFLVATLVVLLFVLTLGWGNAIVVGRTDGMGPFELLQHFALPVLTLTIVISSQMIRMTRAAILNLLASPFIEMAILKGLPRGRIILVHALPNAIGPIVNVIALNLAYLISGVVVLEVFFGYQGLAVLMVQGVQTRDFALVQALGMIFCMTYVGLMLLADLAAIASNPRLRHPK